MNGGPVNQPKTKDIIDPPPPPPPPADGDDGDNGNSGGGSDGDDYRAEGEDRLKQARIDNFNDSVDTAIMNGDNASAAAQDNAMLVSNQSISSQQVTTNATVGAMEMAEAKGVTDAWRNGGG